MRGTCLQVWIKYVRLNKWTCIALHDIAFDYITLHYITWHYVKVHHVTWYWNTYQYYIAVHYLPHTANHTLQYITLQYVEVISNHITWTLSHIRITFMRSIYFITVSLGQHGLEGTQWRIHLVSTCRSPLSRPRLCNAFKLTGNWVP